MIQIDSVVKIKEEYLKTQTDNSKEYDVIAITHDGTFATINFRNKYMHEEKEVYTIETYKLRLIL